MAAALPFVGLAASVASTAVAGFSEFRQGQYQSAVAKNNAKIAAANAQRASQAAQQEQMRSDREYMAQQATALAVQWASGLDVLGRSQQAAVGNIARVRGEAALDIAHRGATEAMNLFQDAANFKGEATAQHNQAILGAIGTGLSIASQVAGSKKFTSLIGGAKSTIGGSSGTIGPR